MSEYADKHSNVHRKERVEHVLNSTKGKVDCSGYTVPGELDTEKKTGPYQPKPRAFAKGGKVEGKAANHHAGRKSRDAGGPTSLSAVQQLRPQVPTGGLYGAGFSPTHSGMLAQGAGLKKGGEAKKRADGGEAMRAESKFRKGDKVRDIYGKNDVVTDVRHPMVYTESAPKSSPNGGFHHTKVFRAGDRTPRAEGGRAKGKTNINIIIGAPKPDAGQPPVPPPPSAMPPAPPRPAGPPGGLPPAAMGAMMPPQGGPPPMPPPGAMPRASGGRAYPIDAGARGGKGRLEKAEAYGPK